MKNIYLITALFGLIVFLFFAGCASTKIADLKNESMIGKTVTVSGTVENSIKIGPLSGYTIKDDSGTIGVSSEALPKEGSYVTVRGVVIRDTIFGYYIKPNE